MTRDTAYETLNHISAAIFVLAPDAEGHPVFVAVNSHALAHAGRPLADYLGRTALEVYPAAYGRAADRKHREVLRSGQAQAFELSLPVRGQLHSLRMRLTPVRGADGQVSEIFGTYEDVTPEQNARQARAEFHQLSAEMADFVAIAAHDLRSPMNSILTLTELLRRPPSALPAAALEVVNMIDMVAAKSLDLIGDVLHQSETAAPQHGLTVFSFPVLCHDLCMTLDPQRKHRVSTTLSALRAEKGLMRVALRNLLENAIKHAGKPHLEIDITAQAGLPGLLDITLTDNGRGFAQDTLDAMNRNPFRPAQSDGLFGLTRMLTARGGMLAARNLPDGAGASLRFTLPGQIIGETPVAANAAQAAPGGAGSAEVWPRLSA